MLPRLIAAACLALILLAPGAVAFASSHEEVTFRYDANAAPLVIAAGRIDASGALYGGLLTGALNSSRLEHIPSFAIVGEHGVTNITDATLVIHDGNLAWRMETATAALTAVAPYGFGLGLPRSPFAGEGEQGPGLLLAGPALLANVSWLGGTVTLIPLDANVTVLDSSGTPVAGWERREVNADATIGGLGPGGGVLFEATGKFEARLSTQAIAAGLAPGTQRMELSVRASEDDRFLDAVSAIGDMTRFLAGLGGGESEAEGPAMAGPDPAQALTQLSALSGVLNGAILVLEQPGEGGGAGPDGGAPTEVLALETRFGDRDVDTGPFTLLRSKDLALSWGDSELAVRGGSTLAITRDGVSTTAPLTVGFFPVLSIVLWLGAIAAVVFFFVKKPPTSKGSWRNRLISLGIYVVVLLLVMWYWDSSFADTFGTSVLTMIAEKGLSNVSWPQLWILFGLESIPWTLAALLFALPVRIMLGVALRYRGEGSSFKRIAGAGGLVSLAILGPIYALWIVNIIVQQLVAHAPNMFG